MVEKKLNFNQPILSVRKYSLSLPTHTTNKIGNVVPRFRPNGPELSSGPVRNPGAVPFQWEQAPGQPKAHTREQTENRVDLWSGSSNSSSSSIDNKMEGGNCGCDVEGESSRSFSGAGEHCGEVKKEILNPDKPAFWYRPTFAKTCNEKEVSDHGHGHDHEINLVSIGCLLPRSCVKSSVCVLSPAPAMSVRARLTLFPSGSSSLESGNEGRVSPGGRTDETKRVKTLQELLADEKRSKEKSIVIDTMRPHSSLECKNVISTLAPNQTHNAEKQLARAKTHGSSEEKYSIIPLPRSPSDSWLRRTVTMKASAPTNVSGFRNKP